MATTSYLKYKLIKMKDNPDAYCYFGPELLENFPDMSSLTNKCDVWYEKWKKKTTIKDTFFSYIMIILKVSWLFNVQYVSFRATLSKQTNKG